MKDLLFGERSSYLSHYNRFNITLLNKSTKEPSLMIVFRCYNEGIAFRCCKAWQCCEKERRLLYALALCDDRGSSS